MDYNGFFDAVKALDKNSHSYGNDVLYNMCANMDLTNFEQLAGAMWLIGRSYAASPQRRHYGTDTDKKSLWPVRSDNDGRDQFFSYSARHILQNNPDTLNGLNGTFTYKYTESDVRLLIDSITKVLQFNLALSAAIEAFDYATEVACTNHISFCSKFLHFCYPNSVFIIDEYSRIGASRLFNHADKVYICHCDETFNLLKMQNSGDQYYLSKDVYSEFPKHEYSDILQQAEKCLDPLLEQYNNRKRENARAYIIHCVRSYILGCRLMKACTIADTKSKYMPRLVDTIFLNIKGPLSGKEITRYQELYKWYEDHNVADKSYENWLGKNKHANN